MKRNLILSVVALLLLTACTQKTSHIVGHLSEPAEQVFFSFNYFDENPTIDSVAVVDNQFELTVDTLSEPFIAVATSDANEMWWFIVESGEVVLKEGGIPGGTPLNDAIAEFEEKSKDFQSEEDFCKAASEFLDKHPDDMAGAYVLFSVQDIIGLSKVQELLGKCGDTIKNLIYKFTPEENFKKIEGTSEGKMFTDFEVEYEGKIQKLSDYVGKGKYVLVDFWASWCGPCRGEIPTIKKLYNEYAGDNFDVVGVATWDKPEDTMKAIEEDTIPYAQIMNAQQIGSDAYGIQGIPEIILFGPDGTILHRGLRGEQMVKAVKEALGKE